jgi:hypothetical protein
LLIARWWAVPTNPRRFLSPRAPPWRRGLLVSGREAASVNSREPTRRISPQLGQSCLRAGRLHHRTVGGGPAGYRSLDDSRPLTWNIPVWRRRTNVWREVTSPRTWPTRLSSGEAPTGSAAQFLRALANLAKPGGKVV